MSPDSPRYRVNQKIGNKERRSVAQILPICYTFGQDFIDYQNFVDCLARTDNGEAKQEIRDEVQEFKGRILLTALFTRCEDGDGLVQQSGPGFMRPWNPWTPLVSSG